MIEIFSQYNIDVPCGTIEKFEQYLKLIKHWNENINLVSPKELKDENYFIKRHFIDSLQLSFYLNNNFPISDIGSGAGLPGIIFSIMGYEVDLYEIDQRKATFLKYVTHQLKLSATIYNQDITKISKLLNYNITARAFTDLNKILHIIYQKLPQEYNIILPKGKNFDEELNYTLSKWRMDFKLFTSIIDSESTIIKITKFEKN